MNEVKFEFIKESLTDSQEIIRSIDVKAGAGLAVLIAPIAQIDSIWQAIIMATQSNSNTFFIKILSLLFAALWLLSVLSLIKTISAIDNPAKHIINNKPKGLFYSGGLYDLFFIDAFFNRDVIRASKDVTALFNDFKLSEEELAMEMVFERLKLSYIRDIKIHRLNYGLKFLQAWSVIGILLFITIKTI